MRASKAALTLGDYVVTEAGSALIWACGKIYRYKMPERGLEPDAVVIVATVKALKYHGGANASQLSRPDTGALERGLCNLQKHIENITGVFGLPAVVAVNRFSTDTDEELEIIKRGCRHAGVQAIECRAWEKGGAGAAELAEAAVGLMQPKESL